MKSMLSGLFLILTSVSYCQYFLEQDVFSGSYLEAHNFTQYNGHMYYLGENDDVEQGIYKISGQVGGVELLQDSDGNLLDGRAILGVFDDQLYFSAGVAGQPKEIWVSDGTVEGTEPFTEFSVPGASEPGIGARYMEVLNGQMIFHASDLNTGIGNELWISDGTPDGTQLLADINPDGDGFVGPFYKWNDVIYFIGNDGQHGRELWRTDGTSSGTSMVKDINSEGDGLLFLRPIIFQNKMWIIALQGNTGLEIWSTDGTEEGTEMLVDLFPGGESGIPFGANLVVMNNRLYFTGNDVDHDHELFSTDGTVEGTELVLDLAPGNFGSFPRELTFYNDRLYFAADALADIDEPERLWGTDGTAEGTMQIGAALDIIAPRNFTVFENKLVFTSQGENWVDLLWHTDGSDSGISELFPDDVAGDWYAQYYGEHFIFGGRLFFEAVLDGDADLWSYGSSDITLGVADLPNSLSARIYPNPSNGLVRIDSAEDLKLIRIYGPEGKILKRLSMNGVANSLLDLQDFPSGIYFVEIISENARGVKKLVINH